MSDNTVTVVTKDGHAHVFAADTPDSADFFRRMEADWRSGGHGTSTVTDGARAVRINHADIDQIHRHGGAR